MRILDFSTRIAARTRSDAGVFLSAFPSRSGDFHEIREYAPGDDASRIDWKKSRASEGKIMVRSYLDEVDHPIRIFLDLSPTLRFADSLGSKADLLVSTFVLLVRSAWGHHMQGEIVLAYGWGTEIFPLPEGLLELEFLVKKIRSLLLSPPKKTEGIIRKSLLSRPSDSDRFMFVVSDADPAEFKRELDILSRKAIVFFANIAHPGERAILKQYDVSLWEAENPHASGSTGGESRERPLVSTATLSVGEDIFPTLDILIRTRLWTK